MSNDPVPLVEMGRIDLKNTIKNAKKKSKKCGIMVLSR